MSRASRLIQLLQVFRQHRRPVSGAQLAAATGVSLRTLYRDVETLKGQGAQIDGEAGIGFVLRPGFMLPPLMFSEEEIEALVLGSRWVAGHTDDRLGAAARAALSKIAAVLPPDLRDGLETSGLLVGKSPTQEPSVVDLALLRAAIRRERKLSITYADRQDEMTRRLIWPFALSYFEAVRVLVAWCELRQGFRSFRVDRIVALEPTETRYPRRRNALLKDWRLAKGVPEP